MAKGQPTAKKQRKSRGGAPVNKVVEVNARQIASGTLATTGEVGTDMVNRISDWIQANGKLVATVLILAVGFGIFWMIWSIGDYEGENKLLTSMLEARNGEKAEDVREEFEALAADIAKEDEHQADYYYHYSKALWDKLESEAGNNKQPKEEDRKEVLGLMDKFFTAVEADTDSGRHDLRKKEIEALKKSIEDAAKALNEDPRFRGLEKSKYEKKNESTIVEDTQYPKVRFETNKGDFVIELYQEHDIQNTVKMMVTLIERGFYRGANPSFIKRPGLTPDTDALFGGVNMIGFGSQGMLHELPNENEEDDKADDKKEDDKEKKKIAPYFFILPESRKQLPSEGNKFRNVRGTVSFFFQPNNPHKRGTEFAINLGDNSKLDDIYQVIGRVESGLEILENFTRDDKVYDAYVTHKRKGDYTPKVLFLEGPHKTGIPQLWLEEEIDFVAPRIDKVDDPKIVDNDTNPLVVLSTAKGDILIELFESNSPNTVANFIHLIETGHYSKSNFHRVEPFTGAAGGGGLRLAQGGRRDGSEDFDWTIKNEAKAGTYGELKNLVGTLSMARTSDIHSAGSQFFINLEDMPGWDKEDSPYCVFGRVIENLWAMYELRPDDKITDAWVVQKRDHKYIPSVKFIGSSKYELADKEDEE